MSLERIAARSIIRLLKCQLPIKLTKISIDYGVDVLGLRQSIKFDKQWLHSCVVGARLLPSEENDAGMAVSVGEDEAGLSRRRMRQGWLE